MAVGDNSLEQAISSLRRVLGAPPGGSSFIETVARRGYRFASPVERTVVRESDAALDALLAPHRAFVEGRAALETLDAREVAHALAVFENAVRAAPEYAVAHVGLATACVMRFETTRADLAPDRDALTRALSHAREACRLDPRYAEAWATLGFVLGQRGERVDALAALQRATSLEPTNWRHHFRLAVVSWGEERLSAARRTLALLPGFSLAHWMVATVFVARQLLDDAERELTAGLAGRADADAAASNSRFGAIALYWLRGLVHLARGDHARALEDLERELASGQSTHLYAREIAANTWYAIGALRRRQGRDADAVTAFERALAHIPAHPLARAALGQPARSLEAGASLTEALAVRAVELVMAGAHDDAGRLVTNGLAFAPPGNAAWFLPVEPLLDVTAHPDSWAAALARLRERAC